MEAATSPDDIRQNALQEMVIKYQTELLHICYLYLRDATLAEDAAQETFLKAYRALNSFRGDSGERTWLMKIAINTCRDMQRSTWHRHMDRRVTPDMLPQAAVPFETADEDLVISVMELPAKLKETVLLYYFQNMSVKEIAISLGITSPSVSNRLKRATKKLRIALEGRHYHE